MKSLIRNKTGYRQYKNFEDMPHEVRRQLLIDLSVARAILLSVNEKWLARELHIIG